MDAHQCPFHQQIRVRYSECDMQGIVFNANYLMYMDDVVDQWFTTLIGPMPEIGFDYVVKRATIEWSSPARRGDLLTLSPSVTRWGHTSFDITITGVLTGQPVFVGTLTCVSVTPGTHTPTPIPDGVRAALSTTLTSSF
jgi:acyl-CoA thioester hydrolase